MATDGVDFDQVEQMIAREQDKRTSRPDRHSDTESGNRRSEDVHSSSKRKQRSHSGSADDSEDENRRRKRHSRASSSRRSRYGDGRRRSSRPEGSDEDDEKRQRRHERKPRHRHAEEEGDDDDKRHKPNRRRRDQSVEHDTERDSRSSRRRRSHQSPEPERRRSTSSHQRRDRDRDNLQRRPYLTFNGPGAPPVTSPPHFSLEDEARRAAEQDDRRKREHDEARRDDLTCLVLNLCLKATEKDVWSFFSQHAGKVRDIQVIRDGRSGKSKGVSYVEFYTQESVLKALALSGHAILGNIIKVQASQAEKNRQAKAAKLAAAEVAETGPARLFVGGLVGPLQHISEDEMRQLFSPFGEVVSVEIQCDPYTLKSRGYGFVQFRRPQDAREAMSAMNGFSIGSSPIKVGYATCDFVNSQAASPMPDGTPTGCASDTSVMVATAVQQLQKAAQELEGQESERLDDEGGGLLSGPTRRIALMQKLQRVNNTTEHQQPAHSQPMQMYSASTQQVGPAASPNICLSNLYTQEEVDEEGPSLLDEIATDVAGECAKQGRVLQTFVNRSVPDGRVWVRFASAEESLRAIQTLNGRYFGGNPIKVEFVSELGWAEALGSSA